MSPSKLQPGRWQRTAIAVGTILCMSSGLMAQSSDGSLFGRSKAGTVVVLTSVETGTSRQVKAESDGSFSFSKLPPGQYRVSGNGVVRDVAVALGSGTEVSLDEAQRIEVTAGRARSVIDVSSVESNSVFTQNQIRALPVARSVDAVALLVPGTVKGDDFGDGLKLPSFGGASIAENGYYINGLDVTNIRNFLSYGELPFDAIGQVQVKSGGYGAEYGRSLGGVVSQVTKRGTNEWKGGVSFYWEPKALRSPAKDVADREPARAGLPYSFNSADTSDNKSYVAYGGGPLVKDKLFVFAAVEAHDDRRDLFNQSASETRTNRKPNGMVKLDWSLTDNHLLEWTSIENRKAYTYTDYSNTADYRTFHEGTGKVSTATGGGDIHIAKYTGYLTQDLTVSALLGRVTDMRLKTAGARQAGKDCPVVLDINTSEIGCWTGPWPGLGDKDPLAPDDQDVRKSARFDVEYSLGAHTLRAGIDNQQFQSSEAGGSTFTGGHYYRYYTVPASGKINGVAGFTEGTQFVRDRVSQSTSGTYQVKNSALYLEDSWKISKKVMLYGGLRWESFENMNGDGVPFVEKKNLMAPRTGFAWDVDGDASLKVYGNAVRYYIPVASNTNIRATRGELYTTRYYQFASRDPRTQAPVGLTAEIGKAAITTDGSLPNPGTIADTQLKPMNQDEMILGIQKALSKDLAFGVKVTHRKINAGMDDYCDHPRAAAWITANIDANYEDNLAGCVLMNPGQDLAIKVDLKNDGKLTDVRIPASALGLARYSRTYSALELTLEKPFDGKWGLQGSYTYSKSKGTAEGYVQSNLNQDDAGVTQDFDFGSFSDGANGYLPNDRRHVLKLFGNYQLTPEIRLGFNATAASGRPLSCIGFVPSTVPDFDGASGYNSASSYYCIQDVNKPAVLVQRGSVGRTPWTKTLDVSISYSPSFANNKLTLQADVFNIFNAQVVTELNEVKDYSRAASNGAPPYQVSQNYLLPTSFQTPRYVRLTARYEF
jgi:hypothetical protein